MRKFLSVLIALMLTCSLGLCLSGCKNEGDDAKRLEASAIYKDAATAIWRMLDQAEPSDVSPMKVEIPNHTIETDGEEMFIHNLNVMTCYVNFIGDLYANENFVYTDKVVTFKATATVGGAVMDNTMSITADIDKENNKIFSEILVEEEGKPNKLYLIMDIGYNFEEKKATMFRMVYYDGFLNDQIYTEEGKCYIGYLNDEYQTALDAFEIDFLERKEQGITLTHRFDQEYQAIWDLTSSLS